MARGKDILGSKILTLSPNLLLRDYLVDVVNTGFFGTNPADAALRLLEQAVSQLVREGRIARREPGPDHQPGTPEQSSDPSGS